MNNVIGKDGVREKGGAKRSSEEMKAASQSDGSLQGVPCKSPLYEECR